MVDNESMILAELKNIKALLVMIFTKDMEKKTEKMIFLSKFGLTNHEIAELTDSTSGTVSVTLSNERKRIKKEMEKGQNTVSQSGEN